MSNEFSPSRGIFRSVFGRNRHEASTHARLVIPRPELKNPTSPDKLIRVSDLIAERIGAYGPTGYDLTASDVPYFRHDLAYFFAQSFLPSQRDTALFPCPENLVKQESGLNQELFQEFTPGELPLVGDPADIPSREYQRALLYASKHTFKILCETESKRRDLVSLFSDVHELITDPYNTGDLNKGKLKAGMSLEPLQETAVVIAQRRDIQKKREAYAQSQMEADLNRMANED